jgi:hypothetical protein
MKTYHKTLLIPIFFCSFTMAQTNYRYDMTKECPDNSICDQKFLKRYNHWMELIKKLDGPAKRYKAIEQYRQKYGIPIKFQVPDSNKTSTGGAFWKQSCNKGDRKIHYQYLAKQFFKSEPKAKHITLETITIGDSVYHLPIGSRPFLIHQDQLVSHFDLSGEVVFTYVSTKGKWKVKRPPLSVINKANKTFEWDNCKPVKKKFGTCYKIWNQDTKSVTKASLEKDCL